MNTLTIVLLVILVVLVGVLIALYFFGKKAGRAISRTRLPSKCTLLRVRQKLTRQPQRKPQKPQKKLRKYRHPQRNRPW